MGTSEVMGKLMIHAVDFGCLLILLLPCFFMKPFGAICYVGRRMAALVPGHCRSLSMTRNEKKTVRICPSSRYNSNDIDLQ